MRLGCRTHGPRLESRTTLCCQARQRKKCLHFCRIECSRQAVSITRRGVREDSGPGAGPVSRPTDGGAQARQRHPSQEGAAQARPQGRPRQDRGDPAQAPGVRHDREGLRHPHGRPQVRPGQGRKVSDPGEDQPVEDRGRSLGPPTGRAHWPLPALKALRGRSSSSGTSGAGKGTIERILLERNPELELAVSATTRERRPNYIDIEDYWFLSDEEIDRRMTEKGFLEYVT